MEKLDSKILQTVITPRPQESFKGTFGKVLLVGGNHQYGGAIIMAATAAVYGGTGLVTVACDKSNQTALHSQLPEAMVLDFTQLDQVANLAQTVDTIVIGPGLGEEDDAVAVCEAIFHTVSPAQTLVVDGSAITLIAKGKVEKPTTGKIVYTPHQMEWQRLSGIHLKDQTEENNREAVDKLGATVVLKKHHTEIYTPDKTYQLPIGSAAQAVGGMGDTLAGMVGCFTAQFKDKGKDAVLAAVYAHSAIADEIAKQQYVVLPHQISKALPTFMKKVADSKEESHIGFIN